MRAQYTLSQISSKLAKGLRPPEALRGIKQQEDIHEKIKSISSIKFNNIVVELKKVRK